MTKCRLDTAVVAVSGGVDSALVLALVNVQSPAHHQLEKLCQ